MDRHLHNPDLLKAALEAFTRTTGLVARLIDSGPQMPAATTSYRPDALIEIQTQDKLLRFVVELKRLDRYAAVAQARTFWPEDAQPPLILVAPFITPQTAQRCRDLHLFFMDAAGNAYIDQPGLYVYVTGQKRPAGFPAITPGRMNNPATLKVVFALLCRPELVNCPYREIATAAQVALGTVGLAMKELETRKDVGTFGATVPKRRLVDPERLLKQWVDFYPATLRPKLRPRRFRAPEFTRFAEINIGEYDAYWGGEVAAGRLTHYLKPQTATIYARQSLSKLITDNRLRADVNGDIEALDVFWDPKTLQHPVDIVPPILVYADLVATTDGRNLETARLLYEREITPEIRRRA